MTPSRSTLARPRTSRMVSSACSQVTFFREIETRPLTSSPATMFRPLSAARIRRRLTTSASLKSIEISFSPVAGAEAGGGGGAGAWVVAAWASIWRVGADCCGVAAGAGLADGVAAAVTGTWTAGSLLIGVAAVIGLSAGAVAATTTGLTAGLGASVETSALAGTTTGLSAGFASTVFTTGAGLATGFGASDAPEDTFALSGLLVVSALASDKRPFGLSTATTSPSGVSSIRYPTSALVISTTTRAMPLRHWLPRTSFTGSTPEVQRTFAEL